MKEEYIGHWIRTRRDIHSHPELSYQEQRTSNIVATRLIELGYEVETEIGQTGVVGRLRGTLTRPGHKRIGLRADMDALPIQEINQFEHRSKFPGKMHACGHDGHVAMLLGAAQILAENREFNGEVVLIFQPAEEGGAGAKAMVDAGLFERFPVDAMYALHNWPGLGEGEFAVHTGPVMASSNEFKVIIHAKGAHAAMPDLGIDPVVIAAHLIQAYQTIISRTRKPVDPAVLSVTQINAGEAINVIPETATLKGTVRTFSHETLDLIEERLISMTQQLCTTFGARAEVEFNRSYPPTINTAAEAELAANVLKRMPQVSAVHTNLPPTMGAEDFAYFLKEKPGAYLWIGNGLGGHRELGHGMGPCMLHNPSYDFNDKILPLGVRFWKELVFEYLNN